MYAKLDLIGFNIFSAQPPVGFVKRQEFSKHHDPSTGLELPLPDEALG